MSKLCLCAFVLATVAFVGCVEDPDPNSEDAEFPDAVPEGDADTTAGDDDAVATVVCDPGFEPRGKSCVGNKSSLWTLHIDDAVVPPTKPSGANWDGDDDPPDPYVQVVYGFDGVAMEVQAEDVFKPLYDYNLVRRKTLAEYRVSLVLSMWDADDYLNRDDAIAVCNLEVPDSLLGVPFNARDVRGSCPDVNVQFVYAGK